MSERFYIPQPISGDQASISAAEAHHLLHVMRVKPGARVVLFDGHGAEFDAEVTECGRSEVELCVLERREVCRELEHPLVLAVALPKGDRQKVLVEKLTELGVARLVPLATERTVAKATSSGLEKLRRVVIEASKQCGRNRLMEITDPRQFASLLDQPPQEALRFLAHPAGGTREFLPSETWCAIGPEGGFTDHEAQQAAEAGWQTIGLGRTILRVETAAIAVASRAVVSRLPVTEG